MLLKQCTVLAKFAQERQKEHYLVHQQSERDVNAICEETEKGSMWLHVRLKLSSLNHTVKSFKKGQLMQQN